VGHIRRVAAAKFAAKNLLQTIRGPQEIAAL
jgi:hypothetical protein